MAGLQKLNFLKIVVRAELRSIKPGLNERKEIYPVVVADA